MKHIVFIICLNCTTFHIAVQHVFVTVRFANDSDHAFLSWIVTNWCELYGKSYELPLGKQKKGDKNENQIATILSFQSDL